MGHADKQILSILNWGEIDYFADTPPISRITGHHSQTMQYVTEFSEQIDKEISTEFIGEEFSRTITLPFHVSPGLLVEDRKNHKQRYIWEANFPKPTQKFGQFNDESGKRPVSSNSYTILRNDEKFE